MKHRQNLTYFDIEMITDIGKISKFRREHSNVTFAVTWQNIELVLVLVSPNMTVNNFNSQQSTDKVPPDLKSPHSTLYSQTPASSFCSKQPINHSLSNALPPFLYPLNMDYYHVLHFAIAPFYFCFAFTEVKKL